MRKLMTLVGFTLLLAACSQTPEYQIAGTIENTQLDGNYVYLYAFGSHDAALDSALIENGKFAFKGVQDEPLLSMLRLANGVVESKRAQTGELTPYTALFVLDNSKLNVNLGEVSTVSGTTENDAFYALQADLKKLRMNTEQIYADMQSEDADIATAAEKKYEEMDEAVKNRVKEYINNHTDKQTAAKLLYDFRHSLDENERREIISKANDVFKAVPGINGLIDHLNVLEKVAVGKKFTDFDMPGLDGKTHKLSEYVGNGKLTLIDFWASWCPPCRADMPHLVGLYKQYKGKGFEIVGISLDRTEDAWKKGLKDLNMTWPQLSDLKFWQCEGAAIYGVNSIPHTVLVDKDGTIIAKNLRGKQLDEKLAEVLK